MRRENSEFITKYISEAGSKKVNKEYFGFVELDKYICFVVADSLDNSTNEISAKIVVDSIINDFTNKPTFSKRKLRGYAKNANEQLKIQSTNFKLSASVLIVVSNYQKLRYVSCGNASLSIFRGNNILLRSEEQSVYRHMIKQNETHEESELGLAESRNLYNYLGKDGKFKSKISKKIKLQQDDVLLMSTWGFWNKVSGVEILDALEGSKDTTTFLGNAQDLLLSKQEMNPNENNGIATGIGSYTLITTFINKLYVDKSNKKKYIRIAIIVTIILLIIFAIVFFIMYRNNKKRDESIDLINTYETKADIFLEDENYQRAFDQYTKAVEESKALTKKTGEKGLENIDIKERLDTKERVSSLILDGDNLYKEQGYKEAKNTYKRALSEINANLDFFSEMELDVKELEQKIENCDDEIYLQDLLDLGIAEKDLGQYDDAKATLEQARKLALSIGNKSAQKEIDILLKGISSQVKANKKEEEEEAKALAEQEKAELEAQKVEEEKAIEEEIEARTKIADEIVISGDAAVGDEKFDVAMDLYDDAMAIYQELSDTENMSKVQKLISEMKVLESDSINAIKYVDGDNYITVGDEHLEKGEFDLARNNYNEALKIFTDLQDKDYMLIVRTKLSEVDSAEKALEKELTTIKAEDYVKKGDTYLEDGNYKDAIEKYKLAQIVYQELANIEKVLELDKKIDSVEELDKTTKSTNDNNNDTSNKKND